ncbi:MAG: ATP-binding protein [Pseudoxanthomonas sp.]
MKLADNTPIILPAMLETRVLVQANSGAGKSWLLRRLLEQTAPRVQQLIIDPEGEFSTLREKFDYVIAAPHDGDAVATPKTAALLARRLLETGVSAVLDIYDLKAHDRQLFVKRFLEALINAPRALWHPVMVVVDEAHTFAPQNGSAEALSAVIDIATRGRKRGQCLVLATQRLSKLHKDAAAEMLNKAIGRTGLDVDVKRAADELGLTAREGTEQLRNLKPGDFFVYGPAFSSVVKRITVGAVQTTHPKAGDRLMQAPPAPSKRVLQSLAKLADLQKEADVEAQTLEQLQTTNADLRRKLTAAEKRAAGTGIPEAEVQQRIAEAVKASPAAGNYSGNNLSSEMRKTMRQITEHASKIFALADPATKEPGDTFQLPKAAAPTRALAPAPGPVAGGLTGPEQRILDAIAWMNAIGVAQPEQTAVAFMAGYTVGGGAWNNPRGSLRTKGLIEYQGQQLSLTDAGRGYANAPTVAPGVDALHEAIKTRLPGPETKLLTVLLAAYPAALSNDELAERAGYAPKGGAYNNPRGRLRSLGLIEYQAGQVRARDILFPVAK